MNNKKIIFRILLIFLLVVVNLNKIEYIFYKYLIPNESVVIMEIDTSKIKTYEQILQIEEFKGKPSFIYFNTRFNYDRLTSDTLQLNKLNNLYKDKKLNLIYIANGLEDEPKNKQEWEIKINKLNLTGTHISLPDNYDNFHSFMEVKKPNKGTTITSIPHYLLSDMYGKITDTIFTPEIDVNKINYFVNTKTQK